MGGVQEVRNPRPMLDEETSLPALEAAATTDGYIEETCMMSN